MFRNIRNAFNSVADDVSQHFDRSASSSTQQQQSFWNPHPPQEAPPATQRAPPASTKAIKQLPTIRVSPEDLVDPSNRECCVCLDDNKLDDKVTRLPCAHIFHTCCIIDWLSNHSCTCPVCRYELPTDDPQFEAGRIERMKTRKPRYAMHELKRMSIADLLDLNRRRLPGVLEKKDLIQRLIDQNLIDIIPSPEPVEYELEVLKNMKIGELKRTMAEAGVFFRREDVLMKSDMISVFENSGRLILIRSEPEESTVARDDFQAKDNPTMEMEQVNPMEVSSNSNSNIDAASTMDLEGNQVVVETVKDDSSDLVEGNQVVVETVKDDSSDLEEELPVNNPMDEEMVGPTIEMFPNQNEELRGESEQNETRNDSMSVAPTTTPNTYVPSPLHSQPGNNELGETSVISDTQNSMPAEMLPQQNAETENVQVGEEFVNFDENRSNPMEESDIQPATNGLGQRDSQGENLSATTDLPPTDMDMRSSFHHYTINHLQTLGRDLQIDLSYCLEREEMIDMIINHGVTGNADPLALSPLMFSSWSVSQLRVVASVIKVNLSECTTKDEMIRSILHAGNNERPYLRDYLRALSPLTTKSLPDLRAIARELQINIADCLEKDEIIQRLIVRDQRFSFS